METSSGSNISKNNWWLEVILCLLLIVPGFLSGAGIIWILFSWGIAVGLFVLIELMLGRGNAITSFIAGFIIFLLAALIKRQFFSE